jgi:GT2 family glycosyltransferase
VPGEASEYVGKLQPLIDSMRERIESMERSRFWKLRNAFFALKQRLGLSPDGAWAPYRISPVYAGIARGSDAYALWLIQNAPRASDLARMRELGRVLPFRPRFGIVLRATGADEASVRATIASIRAQAYPNWKIALPAADKPFGDEDFVAFVDAGDQLTPDALFEMALALNRYPDADMLYSDEDELDERGAAHNPHFKPDWLPDSFLSRMYTGRLAVYRRAALEAAGGWRPEFGDASEYDLVLRLSERTSRIAHLPRVLYHARRRVSPGPAAVRALAEALERRGEPGAVSERSDCPGVYLVRYALREARRVSVIVPTRDHAEDVERCLASVFAKTRYPDLEVILLDNGSTDRAALETFERWQAKEPRLRVVRYDVPFNFSTINNYAVTQSTGYYLLFLNNDTEVLSEGWIEALVEQAQRPSIGAVGALLLYPDETVQHAGVIVGIGGTAGHSHKLYPADAAGYDNMLKAINNYSAVTGACLMTRRAVFDEVGGFDESLTVAFNDVDLCLKIGAAGYRIVSLPHVVLTHFESKSRGHDVGTFKVARSLSEVRTMHERWTGILEHDPCYNPNLTVLAEDFSLAPALPDA